MAGMQSTLLVDTHQQIPGLDRLVVEKVPCHRTLGDGVPPRQRLVRIAKPHFGVQSSTRLFGLALLPQRLGTEMVPFGARKPGQRRRRLAAGLVTKWNFATLGPDATVQKPGRRCVFARIDETYVGRLSLAGAAVKRLPDLDKLPPMIDSGTLSVNWAHRDQRGDCQSQSDPHHRPAISLLTREHGCADGCVGALDVVEQDSALRIVGADKTVQGLRQVRRRPDVPCVDP